MSLTEWVTIRTCRFDDVLEKQDVGWCMLYDTILENKRKQSAPARARASDLAWAIMGEITEVYNWG